MLKLVLGVNIDHIATLRQARRGLEPDPLQAALIAQKAGADLITIHLREDRRHIQDSDVYKIKENINIPLNLEMAPVPEIIEIALKVKPYKVTLVPERREEITTEGGLNVVKLLPDIKRTVKRFIESGIKVSMFIEADTDQILATKESGADSLEIHTGKYANSIGLEREKILKCIQEGVLLAKGLGLIVHAGHGLNEENMDAIAKIEGMEELNIGHSIISRAALLGLSQAIGDIKKRII